ncbi:hypothetical protein [Streptomyces sp. HF10]|uniref:hypothetical protein n=1 Tax=Streptomyces sp. HF10 TaxID=2692233 RepID=UPI0013178A34|nr:hypothetical protein [Streptomyces sp. HF10]QHC31110.1 hypothetical protein GR129_22285 [Streptomyces sp. HF10]
MSGEREYESEVLDAGGGAPFPLPRTGRRNACDETREPPPVTGPGARIGAR